ncbi:biotin--[acetyl-CoA-carboxylase] ligase [Rhizobium sp. RU36D]|uniref:biotin--[acetyl-CoA-carboxylase] ligase n=1 Tax=Rhizobium sp. RU36D TaxID=1907415 RepID=UPI00117A0C06|nr:biotin--[acetyl-CoA-carboxylase] ligase [Rhizobium sp. RU36D]
MSLNDFRHEAHDTLASTNSECLARARAGEASGLWITARRQTGGRGRRGRPWSSEPGNLYASLLLINPSPVALLGSLPLAVAVAVHDAVRSVVPAGSDPVEIKWPNDILIGRRKTCGILLEGENLANGDHALVIGIGVNITAMPEETAYPVTRLADHGAGISPDELFARLFAAMADVLAIWDRGKGVAQIAALWRRSACGIGEKINVNLPDRTISGYFVGIDDKGMLILDRGVDGRMAIAAGDVFFA